MLYDLLVLASVNGSQLVQYAPTTRDGIGTYAEDELVVGGGVAAGVGDTTGNGFELTVGFGVGYGVEFGITGVGRAVGAGE